MDSNTNELAELRAAMSPEGQKTIDRLTAWLDKLDSDNRALAVAGLLLVSQAVEASQSASKGASNE